MANRPRIRQRVHAICRASDGSAFRKCDRCGISVPIALADMHDCGSGKNAKRFKGERGSQNVSTKKQSFGGQPRSPFRHFMESFWMTCVARTRLEVDRKGYETWRNMSKQERLPYVLEAENVNSAYVKALLREVEEMSWEDDEADSAKVGKYDKNYHEDSEYYEDSENFDGFESESSESFNTEAWELVRPHFTVLSP